MSYISTLARMAAIAIIVAPAVSFAQQPVARATSASTANQRFVLLQGTYSALVEGRTTSDQHALFKIDTATGEVWIFVTFVKDGKLIQRWSIIDN